MSDKLEADSILLAFAERTIFTNVYICIETGTITGLYGLNGTGKTYLMQVIYGSLNCQNSVRINGFPLLKSTDRIQQIAYLPQFSFIPRHLTIKTVFQDFALQFEDFRCHFSNTTARPNQKIHSLSNGTRRLVEIFVIASSAKKFVLLNEPFTHLDPLEVEAVQTFLKKIKENKGIHLTDHLYQQVAIISDKNYELNQQRLQQIDITKTYTQQSLPDH